MKISQPRSLSPKYLLLSYLVRYQEAVLAKNLKASSYIYIYLQLCTFIHQPMCKFLHPQLCLREKSLLEVSYQKLYKKQIYTNKEQHIN